MNCPNCGTLLPDNAQSCPNCGARIAPAPYGQNQSSQTFDRLVDGGAKALKSTNWRDFFSFRRMITPQLIQILYIIGAIFITLGGLATMFKGSDGYYDRSFVPGGFFGGLIILVFGNLWWRLLCEFIIVIFRINSSLSNIDDNTRR